MYRDEMFINRFRLHCNKRLAIRVWLVISRLVKGKSRTLFYSVLLFQVQLEDQLCEQCQHGRTKLRPVLVQVTEISSVTRFLTAYFAHFAVVAIDID
jgi:hypothetical protein